MADAAHRRFVLTLHGHLPWVLHHGRWPHGETWLFEAAAEVYLPLLDLIDDLAGCGVRAAITLGLTPVLLEQLAHPRFVRGFEGWLEERLVRASDDGRDPSLAPLARRWEIWLRARRAGFRSRDRDLVGAFAAQARAGRIELLSSYATHAYGPLLLHDACLKAQIRIGLDTSERHLGIRPRGLWLPECATRPAGPWRWRGDHRERGSIPAILADHGVTHAFVDAPLVPDPLQPVRDSGVVFFARHPRVSEQVWSRHMGYPGDHRYLEYHKRHGSGGLRYWRVTDHEGDLGAKQPYVPAEATGAAYSHAQHLSGVIREALGPGGVATAPFDAELFGHWWHEGPRFLRDLLLTLAADPTIDLCTAEEVVTAGGLSEHTLPEGSWGEGGDHRVWYDDDRSWLWRAAWQAEDRLLGLLHRLWESPDTRARALVTAAARQLLLLQASDWLFVIHTGGAVDYGWRRLCGHLERFDRLATLAADALDGRPESPLSEVFLAEAEAVDGCFDDIPLAAWRSSV